MGPTIISNATNGMHHPDRENTKYAEQNTKLFTLFCREAIFVVNSRTLLVYNFQMRWRT